MKAEKSSPTSRLETAKIPSIALVAPSILKTDNRETGEYLKRSYHKRHWRVGGEVDTARMETLEHFEVESAEEEQWAE